MRALVTGGTGFVGGAVTRELLDRGHSVRVFARDGSKSAALESVGVEIARGDILDRDSLTTALIGCDALFHAAAIYEMYVPDREVLMRTEIDGTRNAFEAALAAGVRRVVYTSTSACVGERRGETGNEETLHRGYYLYDYEEAKHKAELVAREYADRIPTVTIRPAAVIGPGDLKATGTSMVNFLNGRLPAIFPGVLSYVAINDVAAAHVSAAEQGHWGETYCLAESILTIRELFRTLADLSGRKPPFTVPAWMAGIYARFEEWKARRTGNPPLMTRASFRLATHGFRIDGAKASRELGITYTPVPEALREAIAWYWTNGLLSVRPACV